MLTDKEIEMINIIKQEIKQKGYPPSVREIGKKMNWASSSTVHVYLRRLEEKGYIRRDPAKPRAIEVLEEKTEAIDVPLLGTVAAGVPILAQEHIEEVLPIPKSFVRLGAEGDLFALKVKGDSMIEAAILHGDTVIVHKQSHAVNGDIVVAMIEDEATVKTFYKENGRIRLQPENNSMEPIYAINPLILGKVTAVLRRY